MPIHVPSNGGNTVLPYFIRISEKKLRSDLPSKLLTPGSHLIPALCGLPVDVLSPSQFLLYYICCFIIRLWFSICQGLFAIFSGIQGFFTSPFFSFDFHFTNLPLYAQNDYSIIRKMVTIQKVVSREVFWHIFCQNPETYKAKCHHRRWFGMHFDS